MDKKIHGDPDKIEKASHEMLRYAEFLEDECRALEGALDGLASDWRDQQFREFEKHFLGVSLELKALIADIRKTKPELDKDVRLLREMQALNIKP